MVLPQDHERERERTQEYVFFLFYQERKKNNYLKPLHILEAVFSPCGHTVLTHLLDKKEDSWFLIGHRTVMDSEISKICKVGSPARLGYITQ